MAAVAHGKEIEMVDILHRVGIAAPLSEVYEAIATPEGVAGWWTLDTEGDGGKLTVTFHDASGRRLGAFELEVVTSDPSGVVDWRVIGGPDEWIGTHIRFELTEEDGMTIVLFSHRGWKEPVEFMYHCSTKWAVFLLSLKQLAETGVGAPAPRDVQISNWH
jgi:uncharacterized protein YndB with AHSA1/START domain